MSKFDPSQFAEDKHTGGLIWAINKHFPGYGMSIRDKTERINKLAAVRRRYIAHLQAQFGVNYTEAEKIADGRAEPPV